MVRNRNRKTAKNIALALMIIAAGTIVLLNLFLPNKPTASIYFIKDNKLESVSRGMIKGEKEERFIANELMKGPTNRETLQGLGTEIPRNAKILSVSIDKENGCAEITFNKEVEKYGGGSAKIQAMVAQIVYTFTSLPGIDKVKIKVQGKDGVVLGGEGLVIEKPISREDLFF